jgi:hypothetical protein
MIPTENAASVLLQYVIIQRTDPPVGLRILSDGRLERAAADNPLPGPADRLEFDRPIAWELDRQLAESAIGALKAAVIESGFFNLEPRILINYCKEDPGVAIWNANVDGQSARVVLYDPRPRRSAEIDRLLKAIDTIVRA